MAAQLTQVENLRRDIDRVREEIEWTANAPKTKDDWKLSVSAWVRAQVADASTQAVALRGLRRTKPDSGFVAENLLVGKSRVVHRVSADAQVLPVDMRLAPVLCWLLGDELEQRLYAMIDADEYVPGLPMAERPARLVELREELRDLETREEAVITAAEDSGLFIGRRVEADPAVVLGYQADGELPLPELAGCVGGPVVRGD